MFDKEPIKTCTENAQDYRGLVQQYSSLYTEQLFCLIHKHWRMHSNFRQLSAQMYFRTDWIVPKNTKILIIFHSQKYMLFNISNCKTCDCSARFHWSACAPAGQPTASSCVNIYSINNKSFKLEYPVKWRKLSWNFCMQENTVKMFTENGSHCFDLVSTLHGTILKDSFFAKS